MKKLGVSLLLIGMPVLAACSQTQGHFDRYFVDKLATHAMNLDAVEPQIRQYVASCSKR